MGRVGSWSVSIRRMTSPPVARPVFARAIAVPRVPADALAVGGLVVLTAVGAWDLVVGGTTVGQDTAAFFYPIYGELGDRLRGGDWLPGWNPHQFGGAPLAADPQSGWGYLPAMLLFALLPPAAA